MIVLYCVQSGAHKQLRNVVSKVQFLGRPLRLELKIWLVFNSKTRYNLFVRLKQGYENAQGNSCSRLSCSSE
jgi:hypothetical protein